MLRERSFGQIDGQVYEKIASEIKELLKKFWEMSYQERYKLRVFPDMETDEEMMTRFFTFLRETAIAYPDKNILIVSHGNIMRTALIHLGFGTTQELPNGSIENTGYFVLQTDGIDFFIKETKGINKHPIGNKKSSPK